MPDTFAEYWRRRAHLDRAYKSGNARIETQADRDAIAAHEDEVNPDDGWVPSELDYPFRGQP
jgi:hypothetical protein